jgi:hypothetical protein
MKETIVVSAALAQRPGRGGHAWVVLQYLLGFKRLGYEVLLVDKLDAKMCSDENGSACPIELSQQYLYLAQIMARYGLQECYSLIHGERILGVPRERLMARLADSVMLFNVMGYLNDEALLALPKKRVFLDIDPGFGQMWRALGWADIFRNHDAFLTVGLNVGQPDCHVPTCGLAWIPTRPPVVLEHWPVCPPPAEKDFTSVISWRGAFAPIEYQGKTYGLRCHEFRRFVELPRTTGRKFRLALDLHANESRDLELLQSSGWTLDNPAQVAYDPESYQHYIAQSAAEFMVAKNLYVQARTGWFSDRTVCYFASGRPAVAQDTTLPSNLRGGRGLLLFGTPEEARDAVLAARRLAEEQFDSDIVLRQLLHNVALA